VESIVAFAWPGLFRLRIPLALLDSTELPLLVLLFAVVLWAVAWLPVEEVVHEFSFGSKRNRIFLSSFLWILLLNCGGRVQSFADPFLALFPVLAVLIVV